MVKLGGPGGGGIDVASILAGLGGAHELLRRYCFPPGHHARLCV